MAGKRMNKKHEQYMNKPGILITKLKIETITKITLGIFKKMIRKSFYICNNI